MDNKRIKLSDQSEWEKKDKSQKNSKPEFYLIVDENGR